MDADAFRNHDVLVPQIGVQICSRPIRRLSNVPDEEQLVVKRGCVQRGEIVEDRVEVCHGLGNEPPPAAHSDKGADAIFGRERAHARNCRLGANAEVARQGSVARGAKVYADAK
ncbi:hypothetical protein [Candidatus Palauibacter sp.]|uniref:hypothetical protein n=1 Tax=Candidatus Palauibacter sp. TaxID=3101350 RepID=UPI003C6F3FAC